MKYVVSKLKYTEQFADFKTMPQWVLDLVESEKLTDISWRKDDCPSFLLTITGSESDMTEQSVTLWVDHENPEDRRIEETPLFSVVRDHVDNHTTLLETEDSAEAEKFVKQHIQDLETDDCVEAMGTFGTLGTLGAMKLHPQEFGVDEIIAEFDADNLNEMNEALSSRIRSKYCKLSEDMPADVYYVVEKALKF